MHIYDVICKVIHKKVLLTRIMPFITEQVALLIYKTMILPYFDYCDVLYHSAGVGILDKLQRLQHKCLKTCLVLHRLSNTDDMQCAAKCSYLRPRRESHVLNFMFTRQSREELLDKKDIGKRLCDATVFKVDFPNKETFKRAVKYSGSILWNNLPVEVRKIDNLAVFKFHQIMQIA